MRVEPSSPTACPVELWFTRTSHVAFGFDTRRQLAARLKLTSHSDAFVFGVEPVAVTPEQIRAILTAAYEGRVEAHYFGALGRMFAVSGKLLADVGLPQLLSGGRGTRYRYSGYERCIYKTGPNKAYLDSSTQDVNRD